MGALLDASTTKADPGAPGPIDCFLVQSLSLNFEFQHHQFLLHLAIKFVASLYHYLHLGGTIPIRQRFLTMPSFLKVNFSL